MNDAKYRQGTAALWFAMDGYSTARGVNGRRIAGESFLKGYLRHSRAKELSVFSSSTISNKGFSDLAKEMGNTRPIHPATFDHFNLPNNETNLYLPTPNFANEAWRRERVGANKYSISGVTHTISTERVLRAMTELRTSPVMPWDAMICTSRAVYDSVTIQLDQYDAHLKHRFGHVPDRMQMPIIPLGINTDDFEITDQARAEWRKKLGIADNDIAVVATARLASFEKFDPIPLFMALQNSVPSADGTVHLIGLGQYSDNVAKKMFENGIKQYAPDIKFHHVDGAKDPANRAAVAAADIFSLPVDNIQETFGLSPVEAMAAGLPVVVTDWNGFRDTVTKDCGFLIRTTGPTPGMMGREAERYDGKLDNYNQFIGVASQMTVVDIKEMTNAFSALFASQELRKKMGAAGQSRAKGVFDWKNIIPQYEHLWAELDDRRQQVKEGVRRSRNSPCIPDPTVMFSNYPTDTFDRTLTLNLAQKFVGKTPNELAKEIDTLISVRGLKALKRKSASMAHYVRGITEISKHETCSFEDLCAAMPTLLPARIERIVIWLMKYGFVERAEK